MLNNSYNINRDFDYAAIKGIVLKSLEKIVKEEASKKRAHDVVHANIPDNLNVPVHSTPSLKLKIRNTTKYLNWRLLILKRDNFTCQICRTSVKANKSLRLEVHHPKAFDEICKENSVYTRTSSGV